MNTARTSIWLLLSVIISAGAVATADETGREIRQGIEAFRNSLYDQSVEHFTNAMIEKPDSPELHFNIGTALGAAQNVEEAERHLTEAARLFSSEKDKAAAYYNLGNIHLLSGNTRQAINKYVEALKHDQQSEDIRHNLEFAYRLQQQQQNSQSGGPSPRQSDHDSEQQQQPRESHENAEDRDNRNRRDNQDIPRDEQQRKEGETDQNQGEKPEPHQQQTQQLPMKREEAEQLLDAMKNEEQKALNMRMEDMKRDVEDADDW